MPDLNARDIEQAMLVVAGTARSMGVDVEGMLREGSPRYDPDFVPPTVTSSDSVADVGADVKQPAEEQADAE